MTKGKRLGELNVKPGDVVERADGTTFPIKEDECGDLRWWGISIYSWKSDNFTIVSHANEPTEDKPKTWGPWIGWNGGECPVDCNENVEVIFLDMAAGMEPRHHMDGAEELMWRHSDMHSNIIAYRIRKEPVRETVTLHYGDDPTEATMSEFPSDTHRITFDTIDGKPDCDSIRMEAIGDD